MRQLVLVILLACACALVGAFVASAETADDNATTADTTGAGTTTELAQPELQRLIDRYRHRVWHWQRVMQRPLTLTLSRPPADPLARIRIWRRISARLQRVALHPPHLSAWACIHRYEGAWTDTGAPYYGGLQMDLGFQRTYGAALLARKGTADHWTPLEQMWTAEKALRSGRGFWPWPNTARYCGLL
jgi:hypothetical protein